MAEKALVILGVIMVTFGIVIRISWGDFSYPLIGLGIVALIAAGVLQMMSRRT